MRDHGGNLDWAIKTYGGDRSEWLDLSTGINPRPYPLPQFTPEAWNCLPTQSEKEALCKAAQTAYGTAAPCIAMAGAQAAIQAIPTLLGSGHAKVLVPTYNEHAASLRAAGWRVSEAHSLDELSGADLAVVVNPNNPNGLHYTPQQLHDLSRSVGHLMIDESFADPHPELSVLPHLPQAGNMIVLRSFGKFYGLAGLRLGFAFGSQELISAQTERSGPWPVSGPAIATGVKALFDSDWAQNTIARLATDAQRLDELATAAGWQIAGGTTLFRLYDTPDAQSAQTKLARRHVWSRIFPYSDTWIRLGLPDGDHRWDQLAQALSGQS